MLPPLLTSAGVVLWGLPEVLATGQCPGAPTDVAAYPCGPAEYILRMTLGPWALMGHTAMWAGWGAVYTIGCVFRLAVRPKRPT